MSVKDIEWIEKCKENPERYKIYVDNDDIFVCDCKENEVIYTFAEFGYYFALQLLQYIGCNADMV
jgi:hypothetical protein